MLKVSAFYLEKQKSFISKKNIFLAVVSKQAKIIPKDGASPLNFPEGFDQYLIKLIMDHPIQGSKPEMETFVS